MITQLSRKVVSEEVDGLFGFLAENVKKKSNRVLVLALVMDDSGNVYRNFRLNAPRGNDDRSQICLGLSSVMQDILTEKRKS